MDLSQLKLTEGVNLTLVEVQSGATNIQHVENYFPNVTSVELPKGDDTTPTDACQPPMEEDEDDIPEWLKEDLDKTFISFSNSIVPLTIKSAAKTCTKPEHFACLMEVCYDHGILTDISDIRGFAKAMVGLGCYRPRIKTKGNAKGEMQTWEEAVNSLANSMLNTTNKLKRDYKAWPETSALKDLKSKCLSLGRIFEDSTIPYKGKE
jgi:hypothetical protein